MANIWSHLGVITIKGCLDSSFKTSVVFFFIFMPSDKVSTTNMYMYMYTLLMISSMGCRKAPHVLHRFFWVAIGVFVSVLVRAYEHYTL